MKIAKNKKKTFQKQHNLNFRAKNPTKIANFAIKNSIFSKTTQFEFSRQKSLSAFGKLLT